jgi:plasmid stabilization system protein ParE
VIVRLVDEAEADIREARQWYRRQRPALASRFIEAVATGLHVIESYPEAQPRVHGSVRRLLLHGFPYALFYFIDVDGIVVTGCFHTARDPSVWLDRSDRYLP